MNEKAIEINRESIEHWRDQKFGMFIHWGLFALHGEGCWGMWSNQHDKNEYALLADKFTAEKFDADVLLIYEEGEEISNINRAISHISSRGESVSAQRKIPERFRYRRLCKISGGELTEVITNA